MSTTTKGRNIVIASLGSVKKRSRLIIATGPPLHNGIIRARLLKHNNGGMFVCGNEFGTRRDGNGGGDKYGVEQYCLSVCQRYVKSDTFWWRSSSAQASRLSRKRDLKDFATSDCDEAS